MQVAFWRPRRGRVQAGRHFWDGCACSEKIQIKESEKVRECSGSARCPSPRQSNGFRAGHRTRIDKEEWGCNWSEKWLGHGAQRDANRRADAHWEPTRKQREHLRSATRTESTGAQQPHPEQGWTKRSRCRRQGLRRTEGERPKEKSEQKVVSDCAEHLPFVKPTILMTLLWQIAMQGRGHRVRVALSHAHVSLF